MRWLFESAAGEKKIKNVPQDQVRETWCRQHFFYVTLHSAEQAPLRRTASMQDKADFSSYSDVDSLRNLEFIKNTLNTTNYQSFQKAPCCLLPFPRVHFLCADSSQNSWILEVVPAALAKSRKGNAVNQ